MKTDLLIRIGEALYGPRWQSELARDLDVSDRTMRRWVSGDSSIPHGATSDMLNLVAERSQLLEQLYDDVKREYLAT